MASYKDFKCRKCLDSGRHQIPCPSEEIGCAVYHSKYCDCEAGIKALEDYENKNSTTYQGSFDSKSMVLPFGTIYTDVKLI